VTLAGYPTLSVMRTPVKVRVRWSFALFFLVADGVWSTVDRKSGVKVERPQRSEDERP
jgi:hypothetical protein